MRTEGYKQLGKQRKAVETQGKKDALSDNSKLGWTYVELARATGLSVSYLQKLVHWERIPFVRIGRSVRFIPEDITAWFKTHRRNHVS